MKGLLVLLFLGIFAWACDDTISTPPEENPPAEGLQVDAGNQNTEPEAVADYPAGPYGTAVGSVIRNNTFYDPQTGGYVNFKDYYKKGKLLLVVDSAGWCGYCRDEAPNLNIWYDKYNEKGLEIMLALFQDDKGYPADAKFALDWIDDYNHEFKVVIDEFEELSIFFDYSAAPLNMVVDTSNMTIIYAQPGEIFEKDLKRIMAGYIE